MDTATKLFDQFRSQARELFGMTMSDLNCKPCSYSEFRRWYNDTHTIKATYEMYLVAQWI